MNRLIVPPLPAASRPSKRTISRSPVALIHYWSFSSSICSSRLVRSYSSRPIRSAGIALAPGPDRLPVGAYQHRLVVVAIVHPQLWQFIQQVTGLGRGADVDHLIVSAHPKILDSTRVS